MRVAGIQLDTVWENPEQSFARARPWIAAAANAGARLVVLPEMYACGFSMATDRIAEPVDGPSTAFLREQARAHGVWVCGSVPELPASPLGAGPAGATRPFNTLVLCAPDGATHRYRKIHPFTFAGEHEHYQAGREFVTVTIEGVRCTLFVCYDLRFADEFWQNANATDCYVVVANWPSRRRHHWQTLLAARAIENQAYVVGVNRVGQGGGELDYSGDSRVVDPWGEPIALAASIETMILAEVDPAVVADARARFPFLRDRR
ncbi:MAG TPA: carbon-nitrogen family hydrolase [Nannocystaceae bacterium]|nr:carbon-nitrogen family hydrolase [Nannocystaceae bacterium]